MKYFLISGEASGDLHGANLINSIKEYDPNAEFQFFGGDNMEEVTGVKAISHNKERSFMGLWEVMVNLGTITKAMRLCKKAILEYSPDVVVFIDYPGFNLRIAKFCKEHNIPTHYFISPKLWAWNTKRVHKLKKNVDHLYSILPFEIDFYNEYDYPIDYVGNPLMDEIKKFKPKENKFDGKYIALLPGSRQHEIENMLPTMYKVASKFKEYKIVLVAAPNFSQEFYHDMIGKDVEIHEGNTYEVLSIAHAALVTSGTATLETALFRVPQVVCYKFSYLSYLIGRMVIKVKYISLVNLILDKLLIKELIQTEFNEENTTVELKNILDGPTRKEMLKGYDELIKIVGDSGACDKTAKLIVERAS